MRNKKQIERKQETCLVKLLESLLKNDVNVQNNEFTIDINEQQIKINDTVLGNIDNMKEVIHGIFGFLKKDELFGAILEELKKKNEIRIPHIISLLCLLHCFGSKVYKKHINNVLSSKYKDDNDTYTHFDFAVLLLALCHDLGYVYELKEKEEKDKQHIVEMYDLLLLLNIQELCKDCKLPQYVTSKTILLYLIKRGMIDHGILGAIDFWKKMKVLSAEHNNDKHYPINLYYYVTSLILVHNIWFCYKGKYDTCKKYEKTREEYIAYGLCDLILEKDGNGKNVPKISPNEDALLFLFVLVDTLDPVKYALNEKVNLNVSFKFENESIFIETDNLPYLFKMEEINNWLVDARLDKEDLCDSKSRLVITIPTIETHNLR